MIKLPEAYVKDGRECSTVEHPGDETLGFFDAKTLKFVGSPFLFGPCCLLFMIQATRLTPRLTW